MKKEATLEGMLKELAPMAGKLEAGTFRVYGLMPVRPGDLQYQLKKATANGDQLDLVFDVNSTSLGDLTISIHAPHGLSVRGDGLTIKKAARVTLGQALDVKSEGGGLSVTTGGETKKQPAFDGPVMEIG